MRRASLILVVLAGAALCAGEARAQGHEIADSRAATPRVVVVRMVDRSATEFAFVPSRVTVQRGEVIQFVQEGVVPHNVEFKKEPDGSSLDGVRMGPFLMAKGDTYEVRIDQGFTDGSYEYVCTPHAVMGMTGTIVVRGTAESASAPQPRIP